MGCEDECLAEVLDLDLALDLDLDLDLDLREDLEDRDRDWELLSLPLRRCRSLESGSTIPCASHMHRNASSIPRLTTVVMPTQTSF